MSYYVDIEKLNKESFNNNSQQIVTEKVNEKVYKITDVLKGILRKMRKYYALKFNEMSLYQNRKRYRKKQAFYVETLLKFIKNIISKHIMHEVSLQQIEGNKEMIMREPPDAKEIFLLMGSMMYPKDFHNIKRLSQDDTSKISRIHSVLYKYS